MKISLASPVYNESTNIQEFIHRSVKSLKAISDDIEIVLVDDYSSDNTIEKIKALLPQYPFIKLINLNKNLGQHIATAIALKHTIGDYIYIMDSDLQTNPEYMIDFFNFGKKDKSWDIISAKRISRSKNLFRKVGSLLVSYLLKKISKTKLKDIGSTFKLFKRNALEKLFTQDILIQNYPILMLNMNFKITEYPIEYNTKENISQYSFTNLFSVLILAFLNFATGKKTLMLLVFSGIFLLFAGVASTFLIIIRGMINQSVLPTNQLVFTLILSIIGIQFIFLSMIVFKIERINKNLDFKKSINQHIEYEN